MPTRRALLHATVAAALGVAQAARAATARYDLLITGGRVIDPASGHDGLADVAISNGRIAALARNLAPADAARVLDARGKIVTPGLIDIHVHTDAEMPPAHCLSTGVTALTDGGSRGADNVEELVRLATAAPNRVRLLLNLGRTGLGAVGELLDFANADVAAARRVVEAHRGVIVGIKARLSKNAAGVHDLDAVRRAHEITVPLGLTLMVHIGQTVSPLPAILALLRPGDIVTHIYAPPPNSMLDANGTVRPEVREARQRGILFDVGNGRSGHITWDVAERALQQDFLPDTISSDLTAPGRTDRAIDFPTVLSKFLMLGLSLDQVIARATVNAARAMPPFRDLGTLAVGAAADVAVFELRDGTFEFVDSERSPRTGRQKLVPYAVVARGTRVV
ncbi:MAG: amidohydrolase/deacetylase family metallohydrolase [Acidobacteriota bacterium]